MSIMTLSEKAELMAKAHASHELWMNELLPDIRGFLGRELDPDEEAAFYVVARTAFEEGWARQGKGNA